MKAWKKERCSKEPAELQQISLGLFIQRRNIRQVHHDADGDQPAYDDYECEAREITESEYHMIEEQEETNALVLINQMDIAEMQAQLEESMALLLLGEEEEE